MTFKPGQSGNPNGQRKTPFARALASVMSEIDPEHKKVRLLVLAEVLASEALAGDMDAIKEVANRLDGRPAQAIVGDSDRPVELTLRWLTAGEALALPKPDMEDE